jgi:hypothetical protein
LPADAAAEQEPPQYAVRAGAAAGVLQNITCRDAGVAGLLDLQPALLDAALALLAAAAAQVAAGAGCGGMFPAEAEAAAAGAGRAAAVPQQQRQHCISTATCLAGALANVCSSAAGAARVAAAVSREQLQALLACLGAEEAEANGKAAAAKGVAKGAHQQQQQQQLSHHILVVGLVGLLFNLVSSHQAEREEGEEEEAQEGEGAAGQVAAEGQQAPPLEGQAVGAAQARAKAGGGRSFMAMFSKAPSKAGGAAAPKAGQGTTADAAAALRSLAAGHPALLRRLQRLAAGGLEPGAANGHGAGGGHAADERARAQVLLQILSS